MNNRQYAYDFDTIARYAIVGMGVFVLLAVIAAVALAGSLGNVFSIQSPEVRQAADNVSIAKMELAYSRQLFFEPFYRLAVIVLGALVIAALAARLMTWAIAWYKSAGIVAIQAKNGLYPMTDKPLIYNNELGSQIAHNLQVLPHTKRQQLPAPNDMTMPDIEVITPELPTSVDLARLLPERVTLDNLTIGQGQNGIIRTDLHDLMHTLAIGASGWGKSTWLRSFLYQLALT